MAITVYDFVENQWYIENADGTSTQCTSEATEIEDEKADDAQRIEHAYYETQLALQEAF